MNDTTNDPLAILFIDRTTPKGRADWLRVVLEKLDSREQQALREAIEQRDAELKRRADKLAEALREVRQWMNEPISANEAERIKRELELLNKIDAALREWDAVKGA